MARNTPPRTNRSTTVFDSPVISTSILTATVLAPAIGVGVSVALSMIGAPPASTFVAAFLAGSVVPFLLLTRYGRLY